MKFIDSSYTNGISVVILEHKGKKFKGVALLHPEDKKKNRESEIIGGIYAEDRAMIKALKYERQLLIQEAEACRKFITSCKQQKTWDNESPTAKTIYHQLNVKTKKINEITDEINQMILDLKREMIRRDVILDAFQNKKTKADKTVKELLDFCCGKKEKSNA